MPTLQSTNHGQGGHCQPQTPRRLAAIGLHVTFALGLPIEIQIEKLAATHVRQNQEMIGWKIYLSLIATH